MSDQPATFDDSLIEWETVTSQNGVSFQIGRGKIEGVAEGGGEVVPMSKNDFGIIVQWPVTGSSWVATTNEVKTTAAITRYKLLESSTADYQYRLEFTNTEHYDYHFFDETGDSYKVNTWSNSNHFVRYNSDKPTIVYIKGS